MACWPATHNGRHDLSYRDRRTDLPGTGFRRKYLDVLSIWDSGEDYFRCSYHCTTASMFIREKGIH
jgi:hypothetical protein